MRIGRIPYINCFPVYGAVDRKIVSLDGELVDGIPSALNHAMAAGTLDISVISAVEYARDAACICSCRTSRSPVTGQCGA